MGLFDSVWVECPNCGTTNEFQSKGSEDCYLRSFTLSNAPEDVLSDVNRHSPISCRKCSTTYEVALTVTGVAQLVGEREP